MWALVGPRHVLLLTIGLWATTCNAYLQPSIGRSSSFRGLTLNLNKRGVENFNLPPPPTTTTTTTTTGEANLSKLLLKSFASTAVAAAAIATSLPWFAPDAVLASTPPAVVVLGSGGKTGKMIVDYLAKKGVEVRPTSYRPTNVDDNRYEGLPNVERKAVADVTKPETLEAAFENSQAVIFASSASKNGGNAEAVDYRGVENVAKECVRLKVPRLVVISSGAITRPDSLGFKFTNIFGRIMEYKLLGENALKAAYNAADGSASYVIIRPGGLADGEAVGPGKIELNQGDSISGEVNRADVAQAAAEAAVSKKIPPAVTFEMYEVGRSGPLEPKLNKISGYERNGEALKATSYDQLFEGLKSGEVVVEAAAVSK